MRFLPRTLLLPLALIALHARAAEIVATAALPMDVRSVAVQARRLDGKAELLERSIEVPGTTRLALPEGLWEVHVADDSVWAPPLFIRDADRVSLRVWPAVAIRGVASGHTSLRVAFTPLDTDGAVGETPCSVADRSWTCAIPPGRYDLRFSSPGSAPEHRFGVTVPSAAETLLHFVAGASLSGRLEAVRGAKFSAENVEISLSGNGGRHTTAATPKGFFQFKSLPPGEYVLRARHKGLVSRARPVTIAANAAAELQAPLLLDHPRRLTVTLTPALAPELKPWRVALHAVEEGREARTAVSDSLAAADGEWTQNGLVPGDYRVRISRAGGDLWKLEDVRIDDADVRLPISVLSERIAGIVTLGDRPLAASLSFGGEGGPTLRSGEDGRFEGEIPPGDEERVIHVEAEALQVSRTLRARLERNDSGERQLVLALPAVTLLGQVLRADGTPQPNAIVTIDGNGAHSTHQTFSKQDGSFQIAGLQSGEYRVAARTSDGGSEPRVVKLAEDEAGEVELIVLPRVIVKGRLAMGAVPLTQAEIHAIPRDTQWAPFMPRATSNEHGRFELELPPRTSIFDLVVVHPAFDVITGRISVVPGTTLHVVANQVGGTLVAETPSPKDLLVRHDGGEYWAVWLAGRAGGSVDGKRVVLPRLEPGEYTVCSAKTSRCAHGQLPPHGALRLAIE